MSDGLPGDDVTETATEEAGRAMSDLLTRITELEKRVSLLDMRTMPMAMIGPGLVPPQRIEPGRFVELDDEAQKILMDNLEDLYER